jgi:peptide-methionine (S)-S-oxide reductase
MKAIVLAGGCFWGVEEFFSRIKGVVKTRVGYANGTKEAPNYEEVCKGNTGYVEACYINYDESVIGLNELLEHFWSIVDPTAINRQGNDAGTQYRTGIYYIDSKDLNVILKNFEYEQKKYEKRIATEIKPLSSFYEAEEYHQKYLKKNPDGYCHIPL